MEALEELRSDEAPEPEAKETLDEVETVMNEEGNPIVALFDRDGTLADHAGELHRRLDLPGGAFPR